MNRLTLQRCWNHADREAVARCPECTRFFCRECVVEHADRIVCSSCLAKLQEQQPEKPRRRISLAPLVRGIGALMGVMVAWLLFYYAGSLLLRVPDDFHAETLWKRTWGDDFKEGARE